ncbi:uncharacterized protein PV07_04120 [Cladophialophora immunda]|uniref:D-xylose reductase [NAD(P)H] n=1 Tax=Cladophialophora immunda TaxID=569365 RepID=A0A0D2CRM5_9EURO|nr:uncharacterized protein PV07_04120 [Cladophialophora immunda]KIW32590.1 hypothetical protein PV07_04120 [Cladophialophora immunda]
MSAPPTWNRPLNHVAVSVPDVEAVVDWYSTHLGFRLLGKIAHIKRSTDPNAAIFAIYPPSLNEVKLAYMATGNGVGFEVFEFVDPKPVAAEREFHYERAGFFHVCVTDPDPDALADRVVSAGGKKVGQTVDPGNVGVKCLYLADPWGNIVEALTYLLTSGAVLATGTECPLVGLGTWQGQYGTLAAQQLEDSIIHALHHGYRLIDTAQYYGVEKVVGSAIRKSGVPRSSIIVITKFWSHWHHDPAAALRQSLADLDIDYIDIFMMHWPNLMLKEGVPEPWGAKPDFIDTWTVMEDLVLDESLGLKDKVRGLGVSNFTRKLLEPLLERCRLKPLVNEVELHAMNPNLKLVPWCQQNGIQVISWSIPYTVTFVPSSAILSHRQMMMKKKKIDQETFHSTLGSERTNERNQILTHPLFTNIAAKHSCSVGVVSLSWAVQRGIIVIPKSSSLKRIEDNIKLVELSEEEMEKLNAAEKLVGRMRLSDTIPGIQYKMPDGRDTILGWTKVDFGWEDEEGEWLC